MAPIHRAHYKNTILLRYLNNKFPTTPKFSNWARLRNKLAKNVLFHARLVDDGNMFRFRTGKELIRGIYSFVASHDVTEFTILKEADGNIPNGAQFVVTVIPTKRTKQELKAMTAMQLRQAFLSERTQPAEDSLPDDYFLSLENQDELDQGNVSVDQMNSGNQDLSFGEKVLVYGIAIIAFIVVIGFVGYLVVG